MQQDAPSIVPGDPDTAGRVSDPSPVLAAVIGLVTGITTTIAGALRMSSRRSASKQDQVINALINNAGKTALLNERIGQLTEALVRLGDLTVRIEAVEQARQGG